MIFEIFLRIFKVIKYFRSSKLVHPQLLRGAIFGVGIQFNENGVQRN